MNLVLDASMALAWLKERDDPREAQLAQQAAGSVVQHGAQVPALWYPEVTNGLLTAERRKIVTRLQVSRFRADLEALPIERNSLAPELTQAAVFALAVETGLTAYDATYLELALRNQAQLATFDRRLADAARAAGVTVFGDQH